MVHPRRLALIGRLPAVALSLGIFVSTVARAETSPVAAQLLLRWIEDGMLAGS